jgi:hypothetical protein
MSLGAIEPADGASMLSFREREDSVRGPKDAGYSDRERHPQIALPRTAPAFPESKRAMISEPV